MTYGAVRKGPFRQPQGYLLDLFLDPLNHGQGIFPITDNHDTADGLGSASIQDASPCSRT